MNQSGKRQEFASGSVRDARDGKGRFDLLPPRAMMEVAKRFEDGAAAYSDRNWEKGQPLSRYIDSALRHAFAVLESRTDENHAAAAAWNWLAFIETRARIQAGLLPAELDDLPRPCDLPRPREAVWEYQDEVAK